MPVSQDTSSLAVNTPLGDNKVVLVRATITEQLGRLFSMDLELSSEDPALDFSRVVGGNATIRLELDKNKTRYWNGYVSRFVQTEADNKAGGKYQATLVPWLWFLTRTADCRIFPKKSVPDTDTVPGIVKHVFREHGFTDIKDALTGHYPTLVHCVQYRETDFNFVSRLMEQAGIYYYFIHENGKHTIVLADGISAHDPYPDYAVIAYRTARGGVAANEAITDWALEQEVQPGTYSLNDFNFEKPKTSLVSKSQITAHNAQSTYEVYDYPGEYLEQSDGTEHAKVRIEELHSGYELVHGVSNARGISTGYTFALNNSPRRDQNRTYLVTSAIYQLNGHRYGSGSGGQEELYSCRFTALDSTKPFRAARITPKPLIQGPQTAMVVGPSSEEIYTDKYGRIVVQFHWDRYGKHDENSSCWIRVSQAAWAGKKWGSMHIPRVGQEVIVEFLEGDPDRPIVTGRVYNADCMPPYDLPAEKTKSTLKSNSSKGSHGYNELRFEDKKSHEQIYIHAQLNMDVCVRNNLRETNFGHRHECIGWASDGGSGGSHYVLVHQDEHTHIMQKHYEEVNDESDLMVKGEMVERFDKNVKIKAAQDYQINATQNIILQGSTSLSLTTPKLLMKGKDKVSLTGDDIVVEGHSICLVVGGSFISIKPDGIAIQGAKVMINSGGASCTSTPPNEMSDFSVWGPIDASCYCGGTGGGSGHYSGAPAVRDGGPVGVTPIPPFIPLPHTPPKPVTKDKDKTDDGCGCTCPPQCNGPYSYHDKEERVCNQSFVLEIVPPSELENDTITVTNKGGPCCCAGALVKLDDVTGHVNVPIKVAEWILDGDDWELLFTLFNIVGPKVLPISTTCGKDQSAIFTGEVHVYPVNKFSISIKALKDLASKCPGMDTLAKSFAAVLSKICGKDIDPYADYVNADFGPFWVKVQAPSLTLALSGQWKENKKGSTNEWMVHKSWKVSLTLGFYVDFRLDIVEIGVGLIPGVGEGFFVIWQKLKDYLEKDDRPPFYFGVRFDFTVAGTVSFGTGTDDGEDTKGAITGNGNGTVSIGGVVTTKVVEASIEANATVLNTATTDITKDGVTLKLELIKFGGAVGKASFKLKAGTWLEWGEDVSMQLIAPSDHAWWSSDPIKII